jgi:hypothetical protein
MEPNSACAAYRSFDFEDAIEYYVIETENGPERRHPHFSMDTGEIYDELSSVCVVSYNGSAVDACLAAEMLFGFKSAAEAADAAKGIASKDMLIAYIKAEDPMTIFADSANAGRVEPVSGSEFSVKTY